MNVVSTVIVALLFLVSLFFQTTIVQAFDIPLGATPIHLAIGFLLLHRGRIELGSAWIAITPIIAIWVGHIPGAWWAYILIAITGPILVKRIFAKRSLLALMGLSWSLYLIFMIASYSTFAEPVTMTWIGFIMLTISLIFIAYLERYVQRFSKRFILVRRKH
ncbi:hypothetical protein HON52_04100 [Candidatus Uhrbacteria bacterium]|jgi:hypothetical protein|nr:hypothetical protein [Candidatus Uhrbacteria bacterium]